jgi:hypothetical protein
LSTPTIYLPDYKILENIENEILIDKSIRINLIKNQKLLKKFDLEYILYFIDKYLFVLSIEEKIKRLVLYFTYNYKNEIVNNYYSPISSFNLQSNGSNLFYEYNNSYYGNVIPYQKFLNSSPLGYYSYTFSLYPNNKQPSGHLNFNCLDNVVINLTNNSNVVNEAFNLKTIVKEYDILRFMSGLGSLSWND